MKYLTILSTIFIFANSLSSQKITSLETTWDDSFKEWTIYTEGDSIEGSLDLTYAMDDNWSRWDIELGEFFANFKLKYDNDPNLWEFRSGNEVITARAVWNYDFTEWRFTDGDHIIKLKSKWEDLPAIWFSEGEHYGYIDIFRDKEEDPRVWIVEDELHEEISPLYRSALIFIAVFHSIPRH